MLVSPEDVAAILSVEPTDALLLTACARASARFEAAVGYPIAYQEDATYYLTPRRFDTVFAPVAPIHEIFSLTDRLSGLELDYLFFDSESGAIIPDPDSRVQWPYGFKTVEMIATTGFEEIPYDIIDAVTEQAIAVYSAPDTTVQQMSQGSRSVSFSSKGALGVTQRWTDAVERYRRVVAD